MPNSVDAFFAADAATAGDRAEPLGGPEFHFHAFGQLHRNDVLTIPRLSRAQEVVDLIAGSDDSFRNQKTGCEFFVMAWCAHGSGEIFSAKANFERFLDGEIVVVVFERAVVFSPNDLSGTDALLFHGIESDGIMGPVEICHLYISRGHNFFGHHGREPGTHAAMEVLSIECVAGQGIRGDRFFDFQENYKGQITFFSLEVFDELCGALAVQDCSPGSVRRNVFTRGSDLNKLIGKDFEIQGIHFHGTTECSPCDWMDEAIGPGAKDFLKGRGGLRARILSDGTLRSTARISETVG